MQRSDGYNSNLSNSLDNAPFVSVTVWVISIFRKKAQEAHCKYLQLMTAAWRLDWTNILLSNKIATHIDTIGTIQNVPYKNIQLQISGVIYGITQKQW